MIDRGFDDKLWSLIEDCWSQEPSDRPTAATVSFRLGDLSGSPVKPEFVQPHTTLKHDQERSISINKEHSSTGRAGEISSCHQPNVVPLAQFQNVRNSTDITTDLRDRENYRNGSVTRCVPIQGKKPPELTFTRAGGASGQDSPKMTSMKNHPVMILCAFSRLFIPTGTDSWY